MTWNPATKRLYVHVFAWPFGAIHVEGLKDRVEYAQLLNDGSELRYGLDEWQNDQIGDRLGKSTLTIRVPARKPDAAVPVIELFLK